MKTSKNKKEIPKQIKIAHRGLWNEKNPENSLGAFKRAIDKDIPIELDIHILKDDTLIVFHDNNLKRMIGIDAKIKDFTYEELKKFKLKDTEFTIPTLDEVLKLVNGRVLIDIEIKSDVKSFKICRELCKKLELYTGDFLIKSFNPMFIIWFRFFHPSYKRGLLVSKLVNTKMNRLVKFICYKMYLNFLCKPDFIAFDMGNLPNKKIDKLYKKGMPIYLWTLRNNKEMAYKYDGIIYEE